MDEAPTDSAATASVAPERPAYVPPPGLTDLLCPNGHIIEVPLDRRWLWHAHTDLTAAVDLTPALAELRDALGGYLSATCEHHWETVIDGTAEGVAGGGERCLWCEIPKPKGSWFSDKQVRP